MQFFIVKKFHCIKNFTVKNIHPIHTVSFLFMHILYLNEPPGQIKKILFAK